MWRCKFESDSKTIYQIEKRLAEGSKVLEKMMDSKKETEDESVFQQHSYMNVKPGYGAEGPKQN